MTNDMQSLYTCNNNVTEKAHILLFLTEVLDIKQ